jgi:hypothetical protein
MQTAVSSEFNKKKIPKNHFMIEDFAVLLEN